MTSFTGTVRNDSIAGGGDADVVRGRAGNDTLGGAMGADTLAGGEGDDRLDGGAGDDELIGGAGRDLFHGGLGAGVVTDFDATEDLILFGGQSGRLTGITQDGADAVLRFDTGATLRVEDTSAGAFNETTLAEWIQGSASGENLRGGMGRELITGGAGDDLLDGQEGADTLEGGAGDDAYYVDGEFGVTYGGGGGPVVPGPNGAADLIVEAAGAGTDTVFSRATYTLGANLENLVLGVAPSGEPTTAGPRIDGRGNALDNAITGSTAGNGLWGEGGNDTIAGGEGGDTLDGGFGRDVLRGDRGADQLIGGAGQDRLTGGEGADRFRYTSLADGGDRITDFDAGEGDLVDLSAIDAKVQAEGDQAFRFVEAFTGRQGEAVLTYDAAADRTTLQLDRNGDEAPDFTLTFRGEVTSDAGWVL